jgi:hypothetical protein
LYNRSEAMQDVALRISNRAKGATMSREEVRLTALASCAG